MTCVLCRISLAIYRSAGARYDRLVNAAGEDSARIFSSLQLYGVFLLRGRTLLLLPFTRENNKKNDGKS